MLSKITLAVLATVAVAKNLNLENYTFDQYLADFKLKFHPSEWASRRSALDTELARVRAHNAKNLSWKEEINKFSILTPAERKAYMGLAGMAQTQETMLKSAKQLPADFKMKPVSELPKEVDWTKSG